ncbi:hypothetical protein BKA60DRAFT_555759 [Fusarium oxysporum]|nr:hypothetical protein BKA60DRAFT_555759 [Fusarium oxysporum]
MERVQIMLDSERQPSEPPGDLKKYQECFWHKPYQFCVSILFENHGDLVMSLRTETTRNMVFVSINSTPSYSTRALIASSSGASGIYYTGFTKFSSS